MVLTVSLLYCMPNRLYEASRRSMCDKVPGERLERVRAHWEQELYRLPRYCPCHSTRPVPPILCTRRWFRPRRPNVSIKLRRQVR